MKALIERVKRLIAWAMATRPARTFKRYSGANGPLLAQGLSYQSIFALFAALWVAFAAAGLVIRNDSPLLQAIIDTISATVPGLIDTGDGGAIDLDLLLSSQVLGWTGAIAALSLLWTALGWFDAARSGMQAMLGHPAKPANTILLKLADFGLAVGFGAAVLVSSALSLFSTSLLDAGLDWVGIEHASIVSQVLTRAVTVVIAYAFDVAVLIALYRVLAPHPVPRPALIQGAALGALGLEVLKALGGALLGGASKNPLLASFAVIVGLLIWFNFVCQVILLGAAWIAETARPRIERMNEDSSVLRDEAM